MRGHGRAHDYESKTEEYEEEDWGIACRRLESEGHWLEMDTWLLRLQVMLGSVSTPFCWEG